MAKCELEGLAAYLAGSIPSAGEAALVNVCDKAKFDTSDDGALCVYLVWSSDNYQYGQPRLKVIGVYAEEEDAIRELEADGFKKLEIKLEGWTLPGNQWHKPKPDEVMDCTEYRQCSRFSGGEYVPRWPSCCDFDKDPSFWESAWIEMRVVE